MAAIIIIITVFSILIGTLIHNQENYDNTPLNNETMGRKGKRHKKHNSSKDTNMQSQTISREIILDKQYLRLGALNDELIVNFKLQIEKYRKENLTTDEKPVRELRKSYLFTDELTKDELLLELKDILEIMDDKKIFYKIDPKGGMTLEIKYNYE